MIAAGIVEAFLGVKAEGESLENIAKPLTAEEDADTGGGPRTSPPAGLTAGDASSQPGPDESRWAGHRLLRRLVR